MASERPRDETTEPAEADTDAGPSRLVVWLRRLALAALTLAVLAAVAVALVVRHFEEGLPSVAELRAYDPPQVTRVLARDGTLLGELFTERRTLVRISEIPPQMKLAVLAAEDAGFYEHAGLNYLGMLRAIVVNLRSTRARQGGSTITQQVIKNVLLTPEKTLGRKVKEALLARRIEQEMSKDEILELYLNQIYFGHGRYGVEEAARFYFGKSVRDVTLAEAAMLAGVVKGPGVYSPRIDMTHALERRAFVLDQMEKKGFAPHALVAAAKQEPITLAPEGQAPGELAPEVVDEVKKQLADLVGPGAARGGFTITTTIDPHLQAAARAAVRRNADDWAKRHKELAPLKKAKREPAPFAGKPAGHKSYLGVVTGADDAKNQLEVKVGAVTGTVDLGEAARYNPKALPASEFAPIGKVVRVTLAGGAWDDAQRKPKLRLELGPEGALVAIDVRSREVLALVGSYEGARGGLDRASHARRQPGSTFKAFVYAYAIHTRQMTPATIVETNPKALKGYRPDNFDEGEGKTPRRLRDALAESVNVAAVWTLDKVGAANVVGFAHALGVESKLGADLSLALGSYEVTPREMAAAYATLAAGGVAEEPVLIREIKGPGGAVVALPPRAPSRRVLDEAEAYVTTSLLTSVVTEGTGKRAKSLGRPVAGKTGTSNQAKDGWFVGYSPDVACAVWTGFDDPTPMGAGEAGATVALPAWIDFMREALKDKTPADFAVPPGVVHVSIDPASGLRAYPDEKDAIDEVFLAGTEPTKVAEPDAGAPEDGADAGAPSPPTSVAVDRRTGEASPPTSAAPPPPPPF
ncbi:MAG TPA: PBP1A family penicillin-binding protein [Minicystis sp.]|nr:PBP1A family penicillin-binding protein [Minicystis sp.]